MLVFLTIGGVGFIVLLLSFLVGELAEHGGDLVHELGDHDVGDHDVEHGHGGPSIFSMRIIAAFATGFGGFGAIARYYEISYMLSSLIGLASGLAVGAIVYFIVKFLFTQQASSAVEVGTLVGREATVDVIIPAGSMGKIQLTAKGGTVSLMAKSGNGEAIQHGAIVTIKSVVGDIVIVETTNGASA